MRNLRTIVIDFGTAGIFHTGMQIGTIIPPIPPWVKFRPISGCFGQFRLKYKFWPKYKFQPVSDFSLKKKKKNSYLLLLLSYGPFFFLGFFFFPFFFFFFWVSNPSSFSSSSSGLGPFFFSSSLFDFFFWWVLVLQPICLSFFICVPYR